MKQVIVTQQELDSVEEARKGIYDFIESNYGEMSISQLIQLSAHTSVLWKIANKVHQEYKGEN